MGGAVPTAPEPKEPRVTMEFTFTEELEQLRSEGRALASLVPPPAPRSAPAYGDADEDVFRAVAAKGIASACLPPEHGGRGLAIAEACALWEGLGEGTGDAGFVLALSVHALLCAVPLWKLGTAEQRSRYLPRVATGEWAGALSLHELEGGASPANLEVRAARAAAGGWLLSGSKSHVVNGSFAHHFLVTAVDDHGEVSAFVVDRESAGLSVERGTEGGDVLLLRDCPVPERALLGSAGAALRELLPLLTAMDSTAVLAPWLGVMQALLERALGAARGAQAFGRPVERLQTVRFALADMRTRCELSRDLVHRAAWQLDALSEPGRQEAAVARLFVTSAARAVTADADRVLALAGWLTDPVAERAASQARRLGATAGGVDAFRSVIAASLLGLG